MITYQLATLDEVDLLVELRIKDLALFNEEPFPKEHISNIKNFYERKMSTEDCFTILGYDGNTIVASGTIYFYDTLPSNVNPLGKTGYISSVWTDEEYRCQGIGKSIMQQLMDIGADKCNVICLNATEDGERVYTKLGFEKNGKAMIYCYNDEK